MPYCLNLLSWEHISHLQLRAPKLSHETRTLGFLKEDRKEQWERGEVLETTFQNGVREMESEPQGYPYIMM